ncbi:MAG TPA: DUF3800 domain-containing protein [Candidatus Dormibacteraeota bacterium]|nr:DUF3800 domain-containing protein [Candidatus Dormibacteraeota bacterium]
MNTSSWISEIYDVVHGATPKSGFMVFKSYMDEAGIDARSPYCSIAGYIAPKDEWEQFERDWRFILKEYMRDLPESERYFHSVEFYENYPKYRSWKKGKRESFINALFRAINDRHVALFLSSVDQRIFFQFTEDERRYLTGGIHNGFKWASHGAPTKPYFLPFQFCMIQGANFVKDDDKIFPIMSRQEQYRMKALELYEQMLNTDPPMKCRHKLADDMVFSDPKKTPPLQAADLAVYWFAQLNTWQALTGNRLSDGFPRHLELQKIVKNAMRLDDLKKFDFCGLMLGLQGCNRYIKTSWVTRDQLLPSLPIEKRKEILQVMRKVNLRRFLDHETLTLPGDHS